MGIRGKEYMIGNIGNTYRLEIGCWEIGVVRKENRYMSGLFTAYSLSAAYRQLTGSLPTAYPLQ